MTWSGPGKGRHPRHARRPEAFGCRGRRFRSEYPPSSIFPDIRYVATIPLPVGPRPGGKFALVVGWRAFHRGGLGSGPGRLHVGDVGSFIPRPSHSTPKGLVCPSRDSRPALFGSSPWSAPIKHPWRSEGQGPEGNPQGYPQKFPVRPWLSPPGKRLSTGRPQGAARPTFARTTFNGLRDASRVPSNGRALRHLRATLSADRSAIVGVLVTEPQAPARFTGRDIVASVKVLRFVNVGVVLLRYRLPLLVDR